MAEENKDSLGQVRPEGGPVGQELDAAGKSLAEALRVSFMILKVIMVVLAVLFLPGGRGALRFVQLGQERLALLFQRQLEFRGALLRLLCRRGQGTLQLARLLE